MPSSSRWADLLRAGLTAGAALLAGGAGEATSQGRQVFSEIATPACGLCHVLAAAGADGQIGPSLDAIRPSPGQVRRALTQGPGNMPSYAGTLSEAQIDAVAKFVASAAGS